jgi:hypothetical protein
MPQETPCGGLPGLTVTWYPEVLHGDSASAGGCSQATRGGHEHKPTDPARSVGGELLGNGAAVGEPENVGVVETRGVEYLGCKGGEGRDGHRKQRGRTGANAGCIEADDGSVRELPNERLPALERSCRPIDHQERITFTVNLHGDRVPAADE